MLYFPLTRPDHISEMKFLKFNAANWQREIHVLGHPAMLPLPAQNTSARDIKPNSGEDWVIDVTGCVYGWKGLVMDMEPYILKRAQRMSSRPTAAMVESWPLLPPEERIENFFSNASSSTDGRSLVAQYVLAEQHVTVNYWFHWLEKYVRAVNINALIAGTHDEYLAGKKKFIDAVEDEFVAAVRKNFAQGDMTSVRAHIRKHVAKTKGVDVGDRKALLQWELEHVLLHNRLDKADEIELFSVDLSDVLPPYKLAK